MIVLDLLTKVLAKAVSVLARRSGNVTNINRIVDILVIPLAYLNGEVFDSGVIVGIHHKHGEYL
jgi:hypothetical protein